ncbi:beta-aspartyl-peptidase [Romboutsia lituseburensis]|uniref:beta-aspartyl-peptidase n=1 Tax=Romboutsia lituseburensis TaxID=1537 RepID=UPI00215A75BE|nr:beta-aspartyl-peptidase [Romboutsia lituseburensis]MCR8743856.1 beta-aspartyl-peptidase [Romboutsia lituseburensis]
MILIKNVEVYSPTYLGRKDVLICGEKISLIEENIEFKNEKIKIIDGSLKKLVPGFIDQHVHITGGGGEGSFRTRVPEIMLSKLTKSGITTVIGLLGTDGTTRSVENLVAKAKALKEEGVSVYVHTGSYEYPTVTLTNSVRRDIVFIDEVIGCKIALSDHRSSTITNEELQRVASDVRSAGMISGKAGILVVHMGDGEKGLGPIIESLDNSEIPARTIRPTHVNRNEKLLLQSFDFAKRGGIIDLTCGIYDKLSPKRVIKLALENGVNPENITISSDGYGSWSNYDEYGNLVKIGVSSVEALYKEFKAMISNENMNIEDALKYVTSNVAKALDIYPKKGAICENSDGDVILLDENLDIDTVIAKGKVMVENKEVLVFGTYE